MRLEARSCSLQEGEAVNLTREQRLVMQSVLSGRSDVAKIAAGTGLHPATVSRVLAELRAAGLVRQGRLFQHYPAKSKVWYARLLEE